MAGHPHVNSFRNTCPHKDAIRAYNNQFTFVSTWSHLDHPIFLFAFDIYRLARFAVRIKGLPTSRDRFLRSSDAFRRCTVQQVEH